jgi:type IV pilus assembly protein PilX
MKALRTHGRQDGAALIVALILLVVMMLLSLSGVRTVAMGERMTANAYDRTLAFQAAESALRAGETKAQEQADAVPPNKDFTAAGIYSDADSACATSPCANGLCSQPDKDCTDRWRDSTFTGWVNASGLGLTTLVTTPPQYFVEYLGANYPCDVENPGSGALCKRFRITARSNAADRSLILLQSIYATE